MVTIRHRGSFKRAEKFLAEMSKKDYTATLRRFGELGVQALAEATPKDSGKTAEMWSYELKRTETGYELYWKNRHTNEGVNIAILLQYGHGTRNGAFVRGRDFINPAIRPVMDQMAEEIWEEVKGA